MLLFASLQHNFITAPYIGSLGVRGWTEGRGKQQRGQEAIWDGEEVVKKRERKRTREAVDAL